MTLPITATLFASSPAAAAAPGEIGYISTGYVNIRVSVAVRAEIVGLTESAMLPESGAPSLQDACVWTNSVTGLYSVMSQEPLTLAGANGSTAPFWASWADAHGTPRPLIPGQALGGLAGSTCSGAAPANAHLTLSAPTPPGEIRAGILVLLIAPL